MELAMIDDRTVYKAINQLRQRSERISSLAKLHNTFVDPGVLDEIENDNHQVLYGRRGTDKTHTFKVLEWKLKRAENNVTIFLDARTLGSTSQFSDPMIPIKDKCLSLFTDILSEIHTGLTNSIIEAPTGDADKALDTVDEFANVLIEPQISVGEQEVTEKFEESLDKQKSFKLKINNKLKPEAAFASESKERDIKNISTSYSIDHQHKIIFPQLIRLLRDALNYSEKKLYILLDEWSSLPFELQPTLAEFIKRGLLPCDKITFKVASIEYRSRFSQSIQDELHIGFELGADISSVPNLDDYYVFDLDPYRLSDIYADMLFKHIESELPSQYLTKHHKVWDGETFLDRVFEPGAFDELSRAAEGVIRDLINIFTISFSRVHRPKFKWDFGKISRRIVLQAAEQWFERDKRQNLSSFLEKALYILANFVVWENRSRFFLVPTKFEKNTVLHSLLDARVIHEVYRGISDPNSLGNRYNAYCLDFGLYVGLLSGAKAPKRELSAGRKKAGIVKAFRDIKNPLSLVLPNPENIFGPSKN